MSLVRGRRIRVGEEGWSRAVIRETAQCLVVLVLFFLYFWILSL
jgi:hypothetical protein